MPSSSFKLKTQRYLLASSNRRFSRTCFHSLCLSSVSVSISVSHVKTQVHIYTCTLTQTLTHTYTHNTSYTNQNANYSYHTERTGSMIEVGYYLHLVSMNMACHFLAMCDCYLSHMTHAFPSFPAILWGQQQSLCQEATIPLCRIRNKNRSLQISEFTGARKKRSCWEFFHTTSHILPKVR